MNQVIIQLWKEGERNTIEMYPRPFRASYFSGSFCIEGFSLFSCDVNRASPIMQSFARGEASYYNIWVDELGNLTKWATFQV